MEQILEGIKEFEGRDITYEQLGKWVKAIDVTALNYKEQLPPLEEGVSYSRNILCLEPFEAVLLHWPAGTESAIHLHEGFFGYVLVLEGECDNVEYEYSNGQLQEKKGFKGLPGGIINEAEGVIHKLKNPNEAASMVTLHFYAPALETLDGLTIYDENGTIGILNESAKTASFDEPKSSFKHFKQEAFTYVPHHETTDKSHRIYPVVPKPGKKRINALIDAYYTEQALYYDSFDLRHPSRNEYTKAINKLIALDLKQHSKKVEHLLMLACGTGRRALNIKEIAELDYEITAVDLSEAMCMVARERGIEAISGDILEVELPEVEYDAATILYAFGHISSAEDRLKTLQKINKSLTIGGTFYFDAFNVNNHLEWGPSAVNFYEKYQLNDFGYESGDVFYKKVDGSEIAYLHYFAKQELVDLLEAAGFSIESIKYIGYVKNSGEELIDSDQGSFFIKAVKKS
jgi:ubiquinone/menaquinone biosynthesis C-methylase UbiE